MSIININWNTLENRWTQNAKWGFLLNATVPLSLSLSLSLSLFFHHFSWRDFTRKTFRRFRFLRVPVHLIEQLFILSLSASIGVKSSKIMNLYCHRLYFINCFSVLNLSAPNYCWIAIARVSVKSVFSWNCAIIRYRTTAIVFFFAEIFITQILALVSLFYLQNHGYYKKIKIEKLTVRCNGHGDWKGQYVRTHDTQLISLHTP